MGKYDVVKIIDGQCYYHYDYIGFLYNELEIKDKKIEKINKLISPFVECGECIINGKILKKIQDIIDDLSNK